MSVPVDNTPPAANQVEEQLTHLGELTGELLVRMDELGLSLSGVLRDPSPNPDDDAKEEDNLVPVAQRIRYASRGISDSLETLADICRRLEI